MVGALFPATGSNAAAVVKKPAKRKPRKSNVYAAALKLFKPKIFKPKKGVKAYSRKKLAKLDDEEAL
jgi:hypothetical protein